MSFKILWDGSDSLFISKRIQNTKVSAIRKLTPFANQAKSKGVNVYHMNIGQPDIPAPKEYFDALKSYNKEILAYENSEGIDQLRVKFSSFLSRYNITYSPNEILITNGGSEALLFSFLTICDEGDEIIVPQPYYSNYNTIANSCGVKLVPFETRIEDGFHIKSKESILKAVTPKTRGILYSNPSNPTGVVYSFDELKLIAEVAKEHKLYIISDEVYRELVYDNLEYKSIFEIEDIHSNLILIDSLSKRYSVCGSRIGMIASKNKDLMGEFIKLCQARLSISSVEQYAATKLLDMPPSYIQNIKQMYEKRRDKICECLSAIEGTKFYKPEGAFYIIVSLPVDNAEEFCKWLLKDFNVDNETVMFAPADGFYFNEELGRKQVRMSYCLSLESIEKAMNILRLALENY